MAARAIWKGRIRFGDIDIPVKLYPAVKSTGGIRFRLLHEKDLEPVRQHMINPATGDVVEYESVHRAYRTVDGDLVMLDDIELAQLEPEPSRDIEIIRFVEPATITHHWYKRPYYLGPDDNETDHFALIAALRAQAREGIARWVMRNKAYIGALRVEGDHLMLITLRNAGEVVLPSALKAPGGRALDARELKLAKQLVASLEGDLDLDEYRDEYRDRVLELVEAKAEGKVVKLPMRLKQKQETDQLAATLEQSLNAAKKRKIA